MSFVNIDDLISLPPNDLKVYKDECAFSFAAPDDDDGIYICLKTFLGIGPKCIAEYSQITSAQIFLHYKITKKLKNKDVSECESVTPKRLAIGVTGGFNLPQDRYTIEEAWSLVRLPATARLDIPCPSKSKDSKKITTSHLENLGLSAKLIACVAAVQCSESAILLAENASSAKEWEAENLRPISRYAGGLVQLNNGVKIPPKGLKCALCDQTKNLWLNLTDGFISCGRRFYDGSGGNNHAIDHYEETKYPLAVKLGTITATGAEVFSYPEDDMVTDPHLARHLAHFGIDNLTMEKTDKTVMEMEIEANERLGEWLALQESDKALRPLYGPGLTGIVNLGNTCYINSALQLLFALPQFRWRYAHSLPKIKCERMQSLAAVFSDGNSASTIPVNSLDLQLTKIGQALCSGEFSWPAPETLAETKEERAPKWPGIRPRMFKYLISKKHPEFASKQQQDVQEFLTFLFSLIESDLNGKEATEVTIDALGTKLNSASPLNSLQFTVEDRLQCATSGKVQYSQHNDYILRLPIPVSAALNYKEVAAYEKRQKAIENAGLIVKEKPVYSHVRMEDCLWYWAGTETIDGFRSPATNPPFQLTQALRSSRLANFPDFLCIQMLKFTIGENWVPQKMNVEIQLDKLSKDGRPSDDWYLDLSALRACGGLQPNEEPMPVIDRTNVQPSKLNADESIVSQVIEMGFSRNASLRACLATSNAGVEAAMNWMMEHMDDVNLNDPTEGQPISCCPTSPDANSLSTLMDMGFTEKKAIKALQLCNNDLERAVNLAFSELQQLEEPAYPTSTPMQQNAANSSVATSENNDQPPCTTGVPHYKLIGFISHMGSSTAAGHYVCHIKRSSLSHGIPGVQPAVEPSPYEDNGNEEWVIFNDDKVARSESPPFQHAYIYLFQRVDASVV